MPTPPEVAQPGSVCWHMYVLDPADVPPGGINFFLSALVRSTRCACITQPTQQTLLLYFATARITMAPIKFSYFNWESIGEPVRLALAQSGVEWVDDRVAGADWPALKPTLPNGQLPVMEVDGVVIPQSTAQLRYVGKIGGLYPTDPVQAALADAAIDTVNDINDPMRASIHEKGEEKKMQLCKDLAENCIPP
ncbi:unnamed protein product [Ectocarpus sp. 12 AP-2014]